MKIINLQQLRQQPEGTVFCKYEPQVFGELELFGGICGEDFVSASLIAWPLSNSSNETYDILDNAEKTGESFKL